MPQSKSNTKNNTLPDFEKSLVELEKIVDRMEQGEQTLEETLKDFERGMALSESCQKSLDQAQQKVEKLVKKQGTYRLDPLLEPADEEDNGDEDDV